MDRGTGHRAALHSGHVRHAGLHAQGQNRFDRTHCADPWGFAARLPRRGDALWRGHPGAAVCLLHARHGLRDVCKQQCQDGRARMLSGSAILALLFAYFTQTVACVAQVSRLPMVAGWDGLLPGWFSQLHPRFKTPVRSLLIVVAACILFGGASLVQVGEQEATQLLVGAGMACSGMYYLTMFAVVLWGRLDGEHAPVWLKIGACSAAGVTILSV